MQSLYLSLLQKDRVCYCNKCLEGGEYWPAVLVRNTEAENSLPDVEYHEVCVDCGERGFKSTEGTDTSDEKHSEGKCK